MFKSTDSSASLSPLQELALLWSHYKKSYNPLADGRYIPFGPENSLSQPSIGSILVKYIEQGRKPQTEILYVSLESPRQTPAHLNII